MWENITLTGRLINGINTCALIHQWLDRVFSLWFLYRSKNTLIGGTDLLAREIACEEESKKFVHK